jgi:hypothetical protein
MNAPAVKRDYEDFRVIRKRRTATWNALNTFVRQMGGAVVSIPHRRMVRVEAPLNSVLPDKFAELGYLVRHHEQATRIGPAGFHPVMVFEVDLR